MQLRRSSRLSSALFSSIGLEFRVCRRESVTAQSPVILSEVRRSGRQSKDLRLLFCDAGNKFSLTGRWDRSRPDAFASLQPRMSNRNAIEEHDTVPSAFRKFPMFVYVANHRQARCKN
jgi:hypothetical protein